MTTSKLTNKQANSILKNLKIYKDIDNFFDKHFENPVIVETFLEKIKETSDNNHEDEIAVKALAIGILIGIQFHSNTLK